MLTHRGRSEGQAGLSETQLPEGSVRFQRLLAQGAAQVASYVEPAVDAVSVKAMTAIQDAQNAPLAKVVEADNARLHSPNSSFLDV